MKKSIVYIIDALILISVLCLTSFADTDPSGVFSASEATTAEYRKIAITIVAALALIAVGAIAAYQILKRKKREFVRPEARRAEKGDRSTSVIEMRPIEEYRTLDPDFDETALEKDVAELYLLIQKCRTKRDVTELRPYLSDDVYNHYEHESKTMMMQGQTPIVERPRVDKATVRGYKRGKFHDHMKVKLEVSLIEYTISDRSRHRRSGSRDKIVTKKYEWDMRRRRSDVSFDNVKVEDEGSGAEWKLDSIKALLPKES